MEKNMYRPTSIHMTVFETQYNEGPVNGQRLATCCLATISVLHRTFGAQK
jgi:hypothetical protein